MHWAATFQYLLIAANYLKPFVRRYQKESFRLDYAQNYKTLGREVFLWLEIRKTTETRRTRRNTKK